MKIKPFTLALVVIVLLSHTRFAWPQGFVNLDFENPIPPLTPNAFFEVPIANAMPGWSAYAYENVLSDVVYNTVSIGSAAISLHGPGSLRPILQGNYTVILQGSTASTPSGAAIGQTGQIPASAQSLVFWGAFAGQVTFSGQEVSYTAIGAGPNYTIYGGNLAVFAGQTGELRFTTPANSGGTLDNIRFSNQPIPEPSTFCLVGLGALLLGRRLRKLSALN